MATAANVSPRFCAPSFASFNAACAVSRTMRASPRQGVAILRSRYCPHWWSHDVDSMSNPTFIFAVRALTCFKSDRLHIVIARIPEFTSHESSELVAAMQESQRWRWKRAPAAMLEQENLRLNTEINLEHNMLASARMKEVYSFFPVAPIDSDGADSRESGTGKELAARAIHRTAARGKPFVPINCRKPFQKACWRANSSGTSAGPSRARLHKRKAAWKWAMAGSVFLDEIGELAPAAGR